MVAGHRDAKPCAVLGPKLVERHGELGAGQGGVAAEPAGQADMVVAALDAGIGIAEIAGDAGADRHRPAGLDQAGGLLDMQFQIGTQPRGVLGALANPVSASWAARRENSVAATALRTARIGVRARRTLRL